MEGKVSLDISVTTVLTFVFVILKLTGYIKWSWLWVLSPIWISAIIFIFITIILVLFKIKSM